MRFTRDDTPQERLHKLEQVVTGRSQEEIALIADMLSLPVDDRYPTLSSSPLRKKEKLFDSMMRGLTNRARRRTWRRRARGLAPG